MKILITGARGFIGRHLIPVLIEKLPGVRILGIDRSSGAAKSLSTSKTVEYIDCDLTDSEKLNKTVRDFSPDRIYHFAGNSKVTASTKLPEFFEKNFLTTQYLQKAVDAIAHPVSIFFSSSVHVYGNQEAEVTETSPAQPVGSYGFTKYLAEESFRHWATQNPKQQRKVVVARLYSCIGPGQGEGFAVSDLSRKISRLPAKGASVLTVGPLQAVRSFLDVRDAVNIFARVLDLNTENFTIFNICSPHQLQISQVLQLLLKIAQKSPKIVVEESSAPNPFTGLRVSFKKLENSLAPLTFRPIEQSLRDIYEGTLNSCSTDLP